MVTNKTVCLGLALGLASSAAWSREAASPSVCQAAAGGAAITDARAALDHMPQDLAAAFRLADAWSDAGCFNDAVQVLQGLQASHPESAELRTRLRVARSLVGEQHFFDDIDKADAEAKLKRATFRCTSLADVDACNEALHQKPDDGVLLAARADALAHTARTTAAAATATPLRPPDATPSPTSHPLESAAPAATPPQVASNLAEVAPQKRFSNAAPETQSH